MWEPNKVSNHLKSSGYHIEWCPSWNPTTKFYVMWKLGLWNSDQMHIYIELKPWHGIKKNQGQSFKVLN
jgi:hypothetical protein